MIRPIRQWLAWIIFLYALYMIAQDAYYYALTHVAYNDTLLMSDSELIKTRCFEGICGGTYNMARMIFEATLLWFWWRWK